MSGKTCKGISGQNGRRSLCFFFVTLVTPFGTASLLTLRQWFAWVLEGVGVSVTPGSAWAALASNALVHGDSENNVMQVAY